MSYYRNKQDYKKRQQTITWIIVFVAIIYISRLFFLQIVDASYKDNADSNAFLKKTIYPSRGMGLSYIR